MIDISAEEGLNVKEYSRLFWAPIVKSARTKQTFKLQVSEAKIDGSVEDTNLVSFEPSSIEEMIVVP